MWKLWKGEGVRRYVQGKLNTQGDQNTSNFSVILGKASSGSIETALLTKIRYRFTENVWSLYISALDNALGQHNVSTLTVFYTLRKYLEVIIKLCVILFSKIVGF